MYMAGVGNLTHAPVDSFDYRIQSPGSQKLLTRDFFKVERMAGDAVGIYYKTCVIKILQVVSVQDMLFL